MELSVPSFTTSVLSPPTCACPASQRFVGGKRRTREGCGNASDDAGVRDLPPGSCFESLRDVVVEGPQRAKSNGRGRRAKMRLTLPSLTISLLLPRTYACRVSAFCRTWDKRQAREVATMSFRREALGTVIFAQLKLTLAFLCSGPATAMPQRR